MRDKKKIIIGLLLMCVCLMIVGYAYLAQELIVRGTSSIGSLWDVRITDIKEKNKTEGAISKTAPVYDVTTATFNAGLTSPGDYIVYEVEISNVGTLDAIVDSVGVSYPDNKAIKYTISGIKKGNKLVAGSKKTLEIKIEYKSSVNVQPDVLVSNITLTINFVECFGTEPTTNDTEDIIVTKAEYVVGERIHFADTDWYVIEISDYDKDYVTLLRKEILSIDELGDAYCVTVQGRKLNRMAMYWNNNCHDRYQYGFDRYTSTISTGCTGHYSYEGSILEEYLNNVYLATLDLTKLKEVDGYKVRLLNVNDLLNNLGYERNYYPQPAAYYYDPTNNTPTFVYQNFGNSYGYWTMNMSAIREGRQMVLQVAYPYQYFSVRPVINVYKSSLR